jgi:hypothetical protein
VTAPPARTTCKVQCKACPWRVDVTPQKDIPGGYCPRKHANLAGTIKEGLASISDTRRIMACHESTEGDERRGRYGVPMSEPGPSSLCNPPSSSRQYAASSPTRTVWQRQQSFGSKIPERVTMTRIRHSRSHGSSPASAPKPVVTPIDALFFTGFYRNNGHILDSHTVSA